MSIDACAEMVRAGDPDRFLSVMTAPVPARSALLVLYAFNLEVARAPWVTKEEMIAEMRLQWWLDSINEIYQGKVRHHEVVEPLAGIIETHDLPQNLFVELIEARRFDIYREGHKDQDAFKAYINATSSNLMRLTAQTLSSEIEDSSIIQEFGFGVGVANVFRALPPLYAGGKSPIPVAGDLDRNAVAGGEVPDNLRVSLTELAGAAKANIERARSNRRQLPKSVGPALLVGWQANVPISAALNSPLTLLKQPLETSEFRKKAELLVRASTGRW